MKLSYKQRIIKLLSKPDYAPLKVNEILLKLGMGRDERKKIKNLLKKMTVAKVILKLNSGGYILNSKNKTPKGSSKATGKLNSKSMGLLARKSQLT